MKADFTSARDYDEDQEMQDALAAADASADSIRDVAPQLASQISYEVGAAQGDSVTNHFNTAAGVPEERRAEIDLSRRATAVSRIGDLLGQAGELLRGRDHEGGGAPNPPGRNR